MPVTDWRELVGRAGGYNVYICSLCLFKNLMLCYAIVSQFQRVCVSRSLFLNVFHSFYSFATAVLVLDSNSDAVRRVPNTERERCTRERKEEKVEHVERNSKRETRSRIYELKHFSNWQIYNIAASIIAEQRMIENAVQCSAVVSSPPSFLKLFATLIS